MAIVLFTVFHGFAQDPCELTQDVKDSIGTYKSTRDYLMMERSFGGNSSFIYFSLASSDGMPMLNVQLLQKSADFIKTNCLDKNSRVYFQLNNGKVVTLMHIDQENCGTMVRNQEGLNNRIISGYFMFRKDSYDELKKSGVSLMRIKFATETVDYIIRPEFVSELDGKSYKPENYFISTLHCLD